MPIFNAPSWSHHQPTEPSPLSSSPIRASSPLSPLDRNSVSQRACFSSPPGPPSKFASRPSKPNPLLRKREEGQETRRQLFLKNVRGRAEDKAWERRSIEGNVRSERGHPSFFHVIAIVLTRPRLCASGMKSSVKSLARRNWTRLLSTQRRISRTRPLWKRPVSKTTTR